VKAGPVGEVTVAKYDGTAVILRHTVVVFMTPAAAVVVCGGSHDIQACAELWTRFGASW